LSEFFFSFSAFFFLDLEKIKKIKKAHRKRRRASLQIDVGAVVVAGGRNKQLAGDAGGGDRRAQGLGVGGETTFLLLKIWDFFPDFL
jgi:histidyl-tRNA synthetase